MTRLLGARAALFTLLAFAASFASATCYVNGSASGSNTGTSWANAYADLQTALGNYPTCVDIYVARGTYQPTATTDRTISFNIKPGVFVYGGFAGTEAALGDRNLTINQTILSGDIGVAGDSSDNSYHVVVFDGTTASGSINGSTGVFDVTIRGGNANGSAFGAYQDSGGGVLCRGNGAGHECSPTLSNLIFENNQALQGGAIYNLGSSSGKASPEITNVILRDNSATYLGGAIYNDGTVSGTSSPLIQGTSFSNNAAQNGGAIANRGGGGTSSPTIRNTTFYANVAQLGGAIVNSGQNGGHASPVLRYVTFNANRATAGAGGAIFNLGNPSGDAAPNISGAIFWGDTATTPPNEMATQSPTTPSIEYSITPECPGGAVGCFNADPLLDPLRDNGGFAPSMRPQIGSPAIEAGNAVNCPAFDQRGILRPQGAQCDIGAVELVAAEKKRCYVNSSALPPNDGLSWGSPYSYLWQALNDTSCVEVWVAKGSYIPTAVGSTNRTFALFIPPGKAVYGGFVSGATLRSQRDAKANPTILTGDIGAAGDSSDNSYHVVALDAVGSAKNITDATILDGFTIAGGNANGAGSLQDFGGGLICNGQGGFICSPTLSNLVFLANHAVFGGAIANLGATGTSNPTIDAVTFSSNSASNVGGAMFDSGAGGICRPVVRQSTFTGNTAQIGGAVGHQSAAGTYVDDVFSANSADYGGAVADSESAGSSEPTYRRVTFMGNSVAHFGGAVYSVLAATSAPRFDDVAFVGNSASEGGAVSYIGGSAVFRDALFLSNSATGGGALSVYPAGGSGAAAPDLDRTTFIGNHADGPAGAIDVFGSIGTLSISNSTFWKNDASSGGALSISSGQFDTTAAVALRNVTFAANHAATYGGAVALTSFNDVQVDLSASDVLLWGDSAGSSGAEMYQSGFVTDAVDHALIQGGCPALFSCSTTLSLDPLLGAPQYNGGLTPTMMPPANSPALENGASCAATDQRGVARPQGAACDIGAVERRATEDYLFNSGFDW